MPFGFVRVSAPQQVRYDQGQDSVTQEFKTFVTLWRRCTTSSLSSARHLGDRARMGQRLGEQRRASKDMTDPLREIVAGRRGGLAVSGHR
jgi:hypothetical protein